jgi:peptidoglycan/LPS O-acetylase OafA/YrhL
VLKQAAAALGFVTNWVEIIAGGSNEGRLMPEMYSHTWPLALEMQFYLVWGFVCLLLVGLGKLVFSKSKKKRVRFFRGGILLMMGIFAANAYFYGQWLYTAIPFAIGACAAALWGVQDKQGKQKQKPAITIKLVTSILIIITVSAAAALLYNATRYQFADEYRLSYGFVSTSLLTVALIYATHGLHSLTPARIKEPFPLRYVADISYDAYLVHWPLYVVCSALILNNILASTTTLALTFVLASWMFYKAERVFTSHGHTVTCPRRIDRVAGFGHDASPEAVQGASECIGALRGRKIFAPIIVNLAALAVVAGMVVLYRAPEITSIENDFVINYAVRDIDSVAALERRVTAINQEPVLYAIEEMKKTGLEANLLPIPSDPTSTYTPIPVTTPRPYPTPTPTPQVVGIYDEDGGCTIIGDSVALGAQSALQRTIGNCYIDAEVARQINAGYNILVNMQNRGELREYVVIALGTNMSSNYAMQLTKIIADLESGHRLIFVTPFDGRANDNAKTVSSTAAWIRELPYQYSYITVADWNTLIGAQVSLLAHDKVHISEQPAANLFAKCVSDALNIAAAKPAKP